MSGSFNKPTGWPSTPSPRAQQQAERFQSLRAAASSPTARTGLTAGRTEAAATETRTRRSGRAAQTAPVVPAGSVTGRSLTLVITIMCFLASLTAGAVYMMYQSASQWMKDIASEVTVQIEAKERADVDKLVADVTGFLSRQPGVARVRALSVADTAQLLEPWL